MKHAFKLIIFLFFITNLFSQETSSSVPTDGEVDLKKNALMVGVLQGGGALLGVDYERMIAGPLGVQVGAGMIGVGAAINYHFANTVNSPAISLVWWNQGELGSENSQQVVGLTYVFRAKGWLHGQLGLGYAYYQGDILVENYKKLMGKDPVQIMALYSIAAYFDF